LQQAAQPAALVQQLAQVAGSLQHAPVQAVAAGLQQPLPFWQQAPPEEHLQPVAKRTVTAPTAARNIMCFMVVIFWCSVMGLHYQ
jgi:hypothetical protein